MREPVMFTDRVKDHRAYPTYNEVYGHRLRKQSLAIAEKCFGKKFDQKVGEIRSLMEYELGEEFRYVFLAELETGHPMPVSVTTFVNFLDQLVQRLCDDCRSEINYRLELYKLPWRVQGQRLEPFFEEA